MAELQNSNPIVFDIKENSLCFNNTLDFEDELSQECVTSMEIFEYIRHINDPEHPLTLEQLNVLQLHNIFVKDDKNFVKVNFTPTIPHCSMATLIGLCIRVQLLRSLPIRFKVIVEITPGTHQSEAAINKQLNDKERVAAALENGYLLDVVNKCVSNVIANI